MVTHADLAAARRLEYGEKYRVEESSPVLIPDGFEQSSLSLPNGAEAVYREDTATDSLQIRVYDDYVTIQRDKYNPKYRPAKHAVFDAPKYTAAAVALIGAAWSSGS